MLDENLPTKDQTASFHRKVASVYPDGPWHYNGTCDDCDKARVVYYEKHPPKSSK